MKIPSAFHLMVEDGTIISLDDVAPKDVQLLAERALKHKEAPESSLAARTGVVPDLDPLKRFLHTIRRTKAEASLRALGEGGWWTQDRLFDAGLVHDNTCKACHGAVGTMFHRCCGCPANAELMRNSGKHCSILDVAQSALHCEEPLFQHGFLEMKKPAKPPRFVERWCGGVEVEGFHFHGDVFSDGSVRHGCRKGNERAGWAAVIIDDAGMVVAGIYGTCPDFFPTSLRAELWAVLQVLRHALPPITIWVDNDGVVGGYARGKEWCCDSDRPAADLWRKLWWKVDVLGGEGIRIKKVKGHATDADIEAGVSTAWHRSGNDHADHFAKRGSHLAEELSNTWADTASCRQAKEWYSWLTTLVANWPKDIERKRRRKGGGLERRPRGRQRSRSRSHSRGGCSHQRMVVADGTGAARSHARQEQEKTEVPEGAGSAHLDTPFEAHSASPSTANHNAVVPAETAKEKLHRLKASLAASRSKPSASASAEGLADGGGLACSSSASRRANSSVIAGFGPGHVLFQSGALTWCRVCGAYGEHRFKALKLPCAGAAGKGMRAGQLTRLLRGEHPLKKGERLPRPVKVTQ